MKLRISSPFSVQQWIFTSGPANSRIFWRQPPQGVHSVAPLPITAISVILRPPAMTRAEMADGSQFFGIARTIERGNGGFRKRRKLFAVGLGCELAHARELVYADELDLQRPSDVVPIGPGCRVCPRSDCVQRAFPPAGKPLLVDSDTESLVSYHFQPD